MRNKVVIAGGTGFIGKYLTGEFKKAGDEVVIISRNSGDVHWKDQKGIISALNNTKLLINLAGKSVDCRYNEKNKSEILRSRTETTSALGEAIQKCENPPTLWINSSTATIYRHAEDRPMTEAGGEIGAGFSVNVAKAWEKSFFDFQFKNTRQVALRMAIVLGKHGGVIKPLQNLVRFGLGGKQGKGNQMFSWIHIDDLFNVVKFIAAHNELRGVYNCSAPNPITNEELMKTLRDKMHMQIGIPSPEWFLKIGAVLINTETELILKSRWVVPEKLLTAGFRFSYPAIDDALSNIIA